MTESPASVLIVEDDQPIRSFLADDLTADGYEVLLAGCIRDAVRQLEYGKPDVVLLDVNLPDGSGLEVLRRTREADGVASRLDPGTPSLGARRRARAGPLLRAKLSLRAPLLEVALEVGDGAGHPFRVCCGVARVSSVRF